MSARGVKGKRRKRKTKPDNKAQSARFIAAAKSLGVDESGKDFENAMNKIASNKKRKGS